ncbi:MAG TPA: sigma-70 family RNA polymerase sigma factor [Solirubrobacteraceae bacterium]|jgi:RNA polymerase sigma-70 factor (ECF subfamily)
MRRTSSPATAGPATRAALRGCLDDTAFDALFRDCAADLHGYAISLLGSRASAEDVTALAFERLYRTRSRFDSGRGTPRAWLFAIARNAALDELRRLRRQPQGQFSPESPTSPPEAPGAAGTIDQIERRAAIRDALAGLPPREREVVLLKFHGQLSNAELAQALDISQSNAGTRLHRALARLRDALAEYDLQEIA